MSKSILIAGKDFPAAGDFASGAETKMRKIAVAHSPNNLSTAQKNIVAVKWLRASPVSARTLVLQCEECFGALDETVLYFDEAYYATLFGTLSAKECSEAIDEMILGFQHLALEILLRYERAASISSALSAVDRHKSAPTKKLVFLLKKSADEYHVKKSPSLRVQVPMASSPFVAAASAAFEAFAQNMAAVFCERHYADIILCVGELGNETAKNDRATAEWLCGYLDDFDLQEKKQSGKTAPSWIRIGTKARGLPFFK